MIEAGFWAQRRRLNREVLIPDGYAKLQQAGNFDNLRAAAHGGEYRGRIYQDSDLFKWLEAVGWELREAPSPRLQRMADEAVALIEAAQAPDGYLDTPFQVQGLQRWRNLADEHEIYCMGHLIEAGLAHEPLLRVARRVADLLVREDPGYCGHPEAELALVALYRRTGERSYLDLARRMIDRRGHGGSAYLVDRVPVREQTQVEGHAVRQLYLNCGATDVYLETGEETLLQAMRVQWEDLQTKRYVTGGVGSVPAQEAFGAPFELPNDTAYAETCAAIASVMWNARMLEATGEVRYADELERALYNAVLVGVARDEPLYAYANPLEAGAGERRQPWFECACCPPNIMRTLASLERYLVSGDRLHQYATGTYGDVHVRTDYPWDGRIEIEGEAELRVPAWCTGARLNGEPVAPGWVRGEGVLELDMPWRVIEPDPRVAAAQGRIGLARGPLVYCLDGDELVPYAFNSGRRPLRVWIPAAAGAA